MPDFEATHDDAPPYTNGDCLIHSAAREHTPVTKVDEEVAGVSMPLPILEDHLGVPSIVELLLFDNDSVADDEHQQEKKGHHEVKVSVLVNESVSEAV